jgi:hypothetical protein
MRLEFVGAGTFIVKRWIGGLLIMGDSGADTGEQAGKGEESAQHRGYGTSRRRTHFVRRNAEFLKVTVTR